LENKPKYIFVGGCGRSGTTLIQKILSAHKNIEAGAEFGFTKDIFKLYSGLSISYDQQMLSTYIHDKKELKLLFEKFYAGFFDHLKKSNTFYISEKTPSNIFVAHEALTVFEDAFFINVIRDGRDVAQSHIQVKKRYKKNKKFAGFSIKSTCRLWNSSIDNYFSLIKSEHQSRIINICYESLIKDPENVLKELFSRLNLDFSTELLSPEKIDNKAHVNGIWYTEEMYKQSFNPNNIGKWNQLGFHKKILISSLTAINLQKLGYSVHPIYIKLNSFLNLFKRESLRTLPFYNFYLQLRLFFS
jgi:protein-tyrosine sulfotransferase